jgi:hypothetical protein
VLCKWYTERSLNWLMPSQWQYLLHNLGSWHGYFLKLSPQGQELSRQPSCVSLVGLDDCQKIRQTVQVGDRVKVLEYSHLARSTLVLPNGAFSQGSMQYTPVGEFGAELGLIHPPAGQRLRLVLLFQQGRLQEMTLIPEHLPDREQINPAVIDPHTISKAWQGESQTFYADWRSPTSDTVHCVYDFHNLGLLLPYQAIALYPDPIPHCTPFSLSLLWLAEPDLLYHLSRRYDPMGGWTELTLGTLKPS